MVAEIEKKIGGTRDKIEDVLAKVRDLIVQVDSIAQPISEKYLGECIQELREGGEANELDLRGKIDRVI